jgi:hypothetical protein
MKLPPYTDDTKRLFGNRVFSLVEMRLEMRSLDYEGVLRLNRFEPVGSCWFKFDEIVNLLDEKRTELVNRLGSKIVNEISAKVGL